MASTKHILTAQAVADYLSTCRDIAVSGQEAVALAAYWASLQVLRPPAVPEPARIAPIALDFEPTKESDPPKDLGSTSP